MINNKLEQINNEIDGLANQESRFKYNDKIFLHENFVLYLKAIYNEVPSQYLCASLIHIHDDWHKITLEVDADCSIPTAQKIHFVFMQFIEDYLPPKFRFSKLLLEWN